MMKVTARTTRTAIGSISLNPFGKPETTNLHSEVDIPKADPR